MQSFTIPCSGHSSFFQEPIFCCAAKITRVVLKMGARSAKGSERMRIGEEGWVHRA
jgi:hypothetical protein